MKPEDFIKNNPFPDNGTEINDILVKDLKDPEKQEDYEKNLYKLLQNNARLIYIIYKQYNYNQSLASIMSFVYEGLKKSVELYDDKVGMPFYHYAVRTTRGILQNHYNYCNDIIHVPVIKKKKVKIEYSEVSEIIQNINENDDTEVLIEELDMIISEYEAKLSNKKDIDELNILKMYRTSNLKEISEKTQMNTVKVKKIIQRTTRKLKKFYINFQKRLDDYNGNEN